MSNIADVCGAIQLQLSINTRITFIFQQNVNTIPVIKLIFMRGRGQFSLDGLIFIETV